MITPMLFCNIGWMKYYQNVPGDIIRGGGSYVDERGDGGEKLNFLERPSGLVYGYVRSRGNINIDRLGAKQTDVFVENVLVVWVSKNPVTGGIFIVGWYEDATVYRAEQKIINDDNRTGRNDYFATTQAWKAVLIPDGWRKFKIPHGADGLGQSHLWYAQEVTNQQFREDVREYIRSGKVV